jgi:hypothetical protein
MVFVAFPVRVSVPRLSATLLALLGASAALAGCSGSAGHDGTALMLDPSAMTIVGLVQNESFVPIAGARVTLRLANLTTTTDAGGLFEFDDLVLSPYLVDVVADGYANATLSAEPLQNVSLSFVLVRPGLTIPDPVTVQFTGYFQCAFEALIIPGSCDFFLDDTGQDALEDQSVFETALGPRWATAVIDLDFATQPGLEGLHVTVRGRNDADKLATYEQYGQFHGTESFSFRVEPNQTYDGNTAGPMPANATALQIDVYPEGYGYHALCSDPVPDAVPAGNCPLGVGAAVNVSFDLYVTVFFVDPAPEGFSLLA